MSSYILVDRRCPDKKWWNEIVRACAIVGDIFEIHCWSDEHAETKAALQFGHKVTSTWHGGTVIQGRITKEFLSYLTESKKPQDTDIYNKMTPFFTIVFGNTLHSEHYGTEIVISIAIREKETSVDRILDRMEDVAIVHRNIRCLEGVRYEKIDCIVCSADLYGDDPSSDCLCRRHPGEPAV